MNNKVQHLANNERYRLLTIDGETYIMDIESPFWKIIFPFLFWLFPNRIFKVEKRSVIQRLKTEKMKGKGGSFYILVTGISYTGAMLLVPLMDYFTASMSLLLKIMLLIFAIILVIILYLLVSRYRKRKLYNTLDFDVLPQSKLWIRPSLIGHFVNVAFSYIFLLGFTVFMFAGYIETENIMMLAISSLVLFGSFTVNRKVVREGNITVKLKIDENVKRKDIE